MLPMHRSEHEPLIERFKQFYQNLLAMPLDDIAHLYHRDILFLDPVHEIRGLDALHAYMQSLCEPLSEGRFEYLDQLVAHNSAYIKWNMHFRHPRLGRSLVSVRGMSHIQFEQQIYYHEDVYDMGALLYEQLPLLGGATRWLKRRLAEEGSHDSAR